MSRAIGLRARVSKMPTIPHMRMLARSDDTVARARSRRCSVSATQQLVVQGNVMADHALEAEALHRGAARGLTVATCEFRSLVIREHGLCHRLRICGGHQA